MQNDSAHNEILLIQKSYRFYLGLYYIVSVIPKKDRFTIGIRCENIALDILEKLYEANAKYGQDRLQVLHAIDTKLKILQALIKALFDIKAIENAKFLKLSEQLVEIGKMLGGWIKVTKSSNSNE